MGLRPGLHSFIGWWGCVWFLEYLRMLYDKLLFFVRCCHKEISCGQSHHAEIHFRNHQPDSRKLHSKLRGRLSDLWCCVRVQNSSRRSVGCSSTSVVSSCTRSVGWDRLELSFD